MTENPNDKLAVSRFSEADVVAALTKAAEVLGVMGAMGLLAQHGGVEMISRLHPHDYEKVVWLASELRAESRRAKRCIENEKPARLD